ncbi:hypothetical protein BOTBODRAFT_32649 [Botryobasidium botryosum FD-172 SS1]|uniref:Zn(2)-C6 fungal-type domain-containing protein n=1 Tax=Botryobasidium botryosum (strain FD-172 SS1) TaxID=930990 RepID=A0A067MRL3_BOTB1|nr:hypothetical protein BOTBODRAFT_32649 [Botryobasidium botryosum FD-172 SS1]
MDNFRFILEEPNSALHNRAQHRKRARLVTACDACRVKKIKCLRSQSSRKCEACRTSKTACLFEDRDRYQAERGMSYSSFTQVDSPAPSTSLEDSPGYHLKRKRSDDCMSRGSTSVSSGSVLAAESVFDFSTLPTMPEIFHPAQPDGAPAAGVMQGSRDLKRIAVPFFRYFGPTANTPGYRRVKVHTLTLPTSPVSSGSSPPLSANSPTSSTRSSSQTQDQRSSPPTTSSSYIPPLDGHPASWSTPASPRTSAPNSPHDLFDPLRPRYPNPKYLPHLAALFFDNLACHFPFLDQDEVVRQLNDGTLPAILANCLAALAVRFSDRSDILGGGPRHTAGEPYADMAKLLIVHMLSWPSLEVLQALVLIAWAEFGSGRDSGLWMYSRMAVGMAMDLGLGFEATVQLAATEEQREKVRLTWWAVLLIDRINSWGTGRPIAIADDQFDTALPTVNFASDEDLSKPPPTSYVFGHLCRLVQIRGRLGDVLNNNIKHRSTDVSVDLELSELQYQMTTFYRSLPPSLVFNIQNFRRFSNHSQAAIFLLLHVMFHSVITLLNRPSLLQNFTPDMALPFASSVELARSSARSIVDMVTLAAEMDQQALYANPFLDLPILTAARAFLAERETLARPPPSMTTMSILLSRQWAETSLEKCMRFLTQMGSFWGGVGCVAMILDQQIAGDMDFDIGEGNSGDSHIVHIRDVELITQWATTAWRRHVRRGEPAYSAANSESYQQPPSPYDGTNGAGSSPEGASVGITGFLDGPLSGDMGFGAMDQANAFRVSFNSAEADLSFPDCETELFSIPDGLEEFLFSHAGSVDEVGFGGAGQDMKAMGMGVHDLVAPAFSTLIGPWFPMGQHLSRAPSPKLAL